MKTNKTRATQKQTTENQYIKLYGFWSDENTGVRLYGAIYYIEPQKYNTQFIALQTRIKETKHQYFDIKFWDYVNLPYKPANTIYFRG